MHGRSCYYGVLEHYIHFKHTRMHQGALWMSNKDNIIMFDDARRKARVSRTRTTSRSQEPISSRTQQSSSYRDKRTDSYYGSQTSVHRDQQSLMNHTRQSVSMRESADMRTNPTTGFSSRVYDDIFAGINHDLDPDIQSAYQEDAASAQEPRSAITRGESRSRGEQKKRDKKSARASRQFLNQFGSSDTPTSESGTRAAVYKGEMGKQHKRAVLQQESPQDSRKSSRGGVSHGGAQTMVVRLAIGFVGTIVVLVMVGAYLYPAAQQYYIEMRNHDRLQVEYETVVARNEAIQQDVDHLRTDEGIEDAARTDLGWVSEGENAVIIQGLPEDTDSGSGTEVHAQVPSSSIEAPETWYSKFLDPFFGYSSSTQAKV